MDTPVTHSPVIAARLAAVRQVMNTRGIHALFVPSSDPHLSEYLPERWKGREWLSNFTGSMGSLAVLADRAVLFADSRYWVQAEHELQGTGITLFKIRSGASMEHVDWLAENVATGGTVAVDGAVLSLSAQRLLASALTAKGVTLRTDTDVFDAAWPERPSLPQAAVTDYTAPHAVLSRAQKLAATRDAMRKAGAQWHVISTLDDIAYLLNLRGSDVSFNPVFVAHAIIGVGSAQLFVADGKVGAALAATLRADGVEVLPYPSFAAALGQLSGNVLIDPRRVTFGTVQSLGKETRTVEAVNPTTFAKSRKLPAEAQFVRETMEHDGAAMCAFYAWFESAQGREHITEITIDEKLTAERMKRPGFVTRSFATIAGFNANGALPHYRAEPATAAVISGDGLLLIDSGGQYLGGTTDITRVWPVGKITDAQRRDYKLVLKGTIGLSMARFPKGTKSPYLDALARAHIWSAGIDYGHGTGHGVGFFMNVHEGPQSISQSMPDPHTAMEEGMITSIEPGIYRVGQWGIRIENLVLNVPATEVANAGFGDFLQFETLTLCPIDTRLIDKSLMLAHEVEWLNRYHAEVRRRLSPRVSGDAKAWLEARTEAI
ncbi:MAG: aminopeptidase P family protein [Burkholderiales bacterium]